MSPDELEELLAAAPIRTLSPSAEARILHALSTAERRRRHWLQRPVPLWLVSAACLIFAVSAGLLGHWGRFGKSDREPPGGRQATTLRPIVKRVEPERPLFRPKKSPRYVLDIRRWQASRSPHYGGQMQ